MNRKPVAPAIDPADVAGRSSSSYPEPFRTLVTGRHKRALGDAVGLHNFGVNLVRLAPGAGSSQRHWHTHQDEFVFVLEGEITLVTDAGVQTLGRGMAAGFPAGKPDGHHLVNRSAADAVYLEIGDRSPGDTAEYPDVDLALRLVEGKLVFTHKNGEPY